MILEYKYGFHVAHIKFAIAPRAAYRVLLVYNDTQTGFNKLRNCMCSRQGVFLDCQYLVSDNGNSNSSSLYTQ